MIATLEAPKSAPSSTTTDAPTWPPRVDVFGVNVTPTTYTDGAEAVVGAARTGRGGLVSCYAVHALMTFCGDRELTSVANLFDMITPDGQPVRWALNLLHGTGLKDRVYGPEFMLRVCERAATEGVSIYLYGGSETTVETLARELERKFPSLVIAGYESPPFRPLTDEEDAAVVERVNGSGAGIVFIGLGCPKQDLFAAEHADRIKGVQVCVGAAFDFHAGNKPMAPGWMQRRGLEWLFRLCQEPRRLWHRYLVTNSLYLIRLAGSLLNVPRVLRQRAAWKRRSSN